MVEGALEVVGGEIACDERLPVQEEEEDGTFEYISPAMRLAYITGNITSSVTELNYLLRQFGL